jgi:hypothetical protein
LHSVLDALAARFLNLDEQARFVQFGTKQSAGPDTI